MVHQGQAHTDITQQMCLRWSILSQRPAQLPRGDLIRCFQSGYDLRKNISQRVEAKTANVGEASRVMGCKLTKALFEEVE